MGLDSDVAVSWKLGDPLKGFRAPFKGFGVDRRHVKS